MGEAQELARKACDALNLAARTHIAAAQFEPALQAKLQVLQLQQSIHRDNHAEIATTLHELGEIYSTLNDLNHAAEYQRMAVAMNRTLSPTSLATSAALSNLASTLSAMGEHDNAMPLQREALDICITVCGDQHACVAAAYENLAGLYMGKRQLTEALPLQQNAVARYERLAGGAATLDHASALNNLATLQMMQGDAVAASETQITATKLLQSLLQDHPDVAVAFSNLAMMQFRAGNVTAAVQSQTNVIELHTKLHGASHALTAQAQKALAHMQRVVE
eukprot:TRINITY_DN15004_c0_g1_i1.p1 TRINITY_DN15004_c0_g1~~TRINITY_DN15004_c0_g1_i1.p1  ORF type:complete len:278 (+),score=63.92 TRINITY_DN15004_c0_g1_i1:947-1780(+)